MGQLFLRLRSGHGRLTGPVERCGVAFEGAAAFFDALVELSRKVLR